MAISKENLGAAIEEIRISNNDSYPSKNEFNALSTITSSINVAQKTVNTRGVKELLDTNVEFTAEKAVTLGTAVHTSLDLNITLTESIESYGLINFQFGAKTETRYLYSKANTLTVDNIVYNDSNNVNLTDGSVFYIEFSNITNAAGLSGLLHFTLRGWFKSPTQVRFDLFTNPVVDSAYGKFKIISIQGVNGVKIDPVEYVDTNSGIEDTPVGHILSLMGKTAPKHYLICDGTIYNISDYPYLSQYIKDQFGSFNFFGGDGTNTFAVPDLRGEFLRGTGAAIRNTGSGSAVGVHQNPTEFPSYGSNTNDPFYIYRKSSGDSYILNADKFIADQQVGQLIKANTTSIPADWTHDYSYTIRPTNTAVLYCIKYEPTYFMNIHGLIEETVLWEGVIGNQNATNVINVIDLNDSIMNYDKIGFHVVSTIKATFIRPIYRELSIDEFILLRDDPATEVALTLTNGAGTDIDYTDIKRPYSPTKLTLRQNQSFIRKIVGIKYKTFQINTEGSE